MKILNSITNILSNFWSDVFQNIFGTPSSAICGSNLLMSDFVLFQSIVFCYSSFYVLISRLRFWKSLTPKNNVLVNNIFFSILLLLLLFFVFKLFVIKLRFWTESCFYWGSQFWYTFWFLWLIISSFRFANLNFLTIQIISCLIFWIKVCHFFCFYMISFC